MDDTSRSKAIDQIPTYLARCAPTPCKTAKRRWTAVKYLRSEIWLNEEPNQSLRPKAFVARHTQAWDAVAKTYAREYGRPLNGLLRQRSQNPETGENRDGWYFIASWLSGVAGEGKDWWLIEQRSG